MFLPKGVLHRRAQKNAIFVRRTEATQETSFPLDVGHGKYLPAVEAAQQLLLPFRLRRLPPENLHGHPRPEIVPVQGNQIFRRAARAAHGHILLLETYVSFTGLPAENSGLFRQRRQKNNGNKATRQKAWERCPCRTSQAAETSSSRPEHSKDARKETEPPFFSTFCRLSGMVVLMLPYGSAAQWPGAGFGRRGVHVRTQEAATPAKATLPLLFRTALVREDAASGMNMPPIPGRRESSPATGRSSAFTGTFPAFIRHRGMFFDQRAHNLLRQHPGRRIP